MLKLILDQDYRSAAPAVDRSNYSNHGRVLNASHSQDGRGAGSGALTFSQADSAVRIASKPCWHRLDAILFEGWVRLASGTGGRRNIIEGDSSFAFFINDDNTLVASLYARTSGGPGPAWTLVSSADHSPDGEVHRVPLAQWCKLVFHFDGLSQARVFINDRLVALRQDFASGLAGVGGEGVVVGNWTLSNQYAFAGEIDSIRLWKRDPDALIANFVARPISPEARDAWDGILACLEAELGERDKSTLAMLGDQWRDLLREIFRVMQQGPPEMRQKFRDLLAIYRQHWLAGTIEDPAFAGALHDLRALLEKVLGAQFATKLESQAEGYLRMVDAVKRCFDARDLATLDPSYANFISQFIAGGDARHATV